MATDRIVLVLADLAAGGTQRVVTTLANYWAENGRPISVITLAEPGTDFFKLSDKVERVAVGGQLDSDSVVYGVVANLSRIKSLRREMVRINAKVCIGFIGQTNILLTLAGLGLSSRIIISERNDPRQQSLGRLWDFLRHKVYPLADMVTANSREVVTALEEFVPSKKLRYLPNPVNLVHVQPKLSDRLDKIIAVGRLHHQKAHSVLITAFASISEQHPSWQLEILGEGDQRASLEALISDLGLTGKVSLPGRVKDVESHLAKASIFVLPSRFEGTPNALLEAISFGLPTVISDASVGALEFVKDQESGFVVPVENSEALAEALVELINNKSLRQKFVGSAFQQIKRLGVQAVAREWEAALAIR
jgi:GalNAc-alpha-(1->4)-GalNAc-alpha-(1->3)-diNAcBac-PP-undecaprenol alpha-1,4-N-acetyl-D-galactosaminyltransferase